MLFAANVHERRRGVPCGCLCNQNTPTAGAPLVGARSVCKTDNNIKLFAFERRSGAHEGRPCGGCF